MTALWQRDPSIVASSFDPLEILSWLPEDLLDMKVTYEPRSSLSLKTLHSRAVLALARCYVAEPSKYYHLAFLFEMDPKPLVIMDDDSTQMLLNMLRSNSLTDHKAAFLVRVLLLEKIICWYVLHLFARHFADCLSRHAYTMTQQLRFARNMVVVLKEFIRQESIRRAFDYSQMATRIPQHLYHQLRISK